MKAITTKQTKAQIVTAIAEETELTKREVDSVLTALAEMAHRHIMPRGSGEFTIPYMGIKVRRIARKARMGRNPATGESIKIPAKKVVKATALKVIKDLI